MSDWLFFWQKWNETGIRGQIGAIIWTPGPWEKETAMPKDWRGSGSSLTQSVVCPVSRLSCHVCRWREVWSAIWRESVPWMWRCLWGNLRHRHTCVYMSVCSEGRIRHAKRLFPRCVSREDIRCDVDVSIAVAIQVCIVNMLSVFGCKSWFWEVFWLHLYILDVSEENCVKSFERMNSVKRQKGGYQLYKTAMSSYLLWTKAATEKDKDEKHHRQLG